MFRAHAIDDGVARDRVEPRRCRAALRAIASGRAPHRSERFLYSVLRTLPVAQPAQSEPEDRADVAPVEELEGGAVALCDANEQRGVRCIDGQRCLARLW